MRELFADFGKGFLMAGACTALFAVPVMRLLHAMRSRQTVSEFAPEGHQKKQGTPTMGGIMVVSGLAAGVLVLGLSNGRELLAVPWMLGFALIGFADDFVVPRLMPGKRGLGWKQKILAQMALAAAAVPILGWEWNVPSVALAVFVVLFACNAYNFADGLDGLAGSLGVVLALGFGGLLALMGAPGGWIPICGALAGALIPFLFLNAPPAKVFMGDVGSLAIGSLMGLFACVLIAPHGPPAVSLQGLSWVVILGGVLAAELIPVPMQVLSVKLTGKKLFLMTPIHHGFEKRGWPETRIVFSFVLVQVVLAVAALTLAGVWAP